jgi:glyoxylase-like metal-dependent hydrolase (beta-lactamase superfamily II)
MPFQENTYIAWTPGSTSALVIDPGLEPERILSVLREEGLTVAAILCTHGHADHIGGNEAVKAAFPSAPVVIGEGDRGMLTDATANLSAPFGMAVVSPPADLGVKEGDVLEYAGFRLEVLDIPGHSPGHVVFVDRAAGCVFGGDVLFAGGVGRGDFPGGDMGLLLRGIREKLYVLPGEWVVLPGHGEATTIDEERRTNPFVRG